MSTFASKLKTFGVTTPLFHVVLGSGFKDAVTAGGVPTGFDVKGEMFFKDIPGIFQSTAPGHAGKFVVMEHRATKKNGVIQVGRLHGYEGLDPREVVKPLYLTREMGNELYFLTNAAGGMDPKHAVGDVMLIQDQVNLTGTNALYGENPKKPDGSAWGPRFQDLTLLYDREWNAKLTDAFKAEGLQVHKGIYVGVTGPMFETPAEIRFFQKIGCHAVGMSTVWEAIAMKHSGAKVVGASLISNLGAGMNGDQELDHFAILDACRASSVSILKGILLSIEQALKG
ncbi:MAG: purine-nucleoside phosphorylase [Bdellovibrionales bacterium]|nr:purine-nucleoside phosphorylase [Bdellovibrionales bacterium]